MLARRSGPIEPDRRPDEEGGQIITSRLSVRLRSAATLLLAFFRGKELPQEEVAEPGPKPYPWEASYPEGLDWQLNVAPKPLFSILDDAIERHADRPCLEFLGKRYTYREVGALVDKAAKGFQELGVGKGVKVGLFLPNSPYFVICFFAVLKAGGTVVNFNPLYAAREVARQIRDSDARIMVTMNLKTLYSKVAGRLGDTGLERVVVCRMSATLPFHAKALFALLRRKELSSIPTDARHVKFEKLIANDGALAPAEIDPERDVAVFQYTGGTTGMPKAAMLSHANLYCNAVQTRIWASDMKDGEERVLAVLPLFHVFGMTVVMNVSLFGGAEIILLPHFKLAQVLSVIDRRRPTVLLGVPTMYSAINGFRALHRYDLSSLKSCISGGAALPLEIKQKFEQLTGCTLVEGYGLSEAAPVCTINPFSGLNKPGSIGLPVPGTVVEIASLDNPDVLVSLGECGEICVSGPQVMIGYWQQEGETAAVLRNGRLHTGDVGYMDPDGYVFLIDRIKDLIITGGYNVYPRMVEEAVYLHPAVEEAVVCGLPDKHRGEIVKAFVKLRDGASLSAGDLRSFLQDKLAPFELPKSIEFRNEIPKTLIGKPDRQQLIAEEMRKRQRRESFQTFQPSEPPPDASPPVQVETHSGTSAP